MTEENQVQPENCRGDQLPLITESSHDGQSSYRDMAISPKFHGSKRIGSIQDDVTLDGDADEGDDYDG